MNEKEILELLLTKVTGIEGNVSELKEDVSELKENVSELKENVSELKENVSRLNVRMGKLENKVDNIELRVGEIDEHVVSIQITLENEIHFSIGAIADGHHDMSRKLDEIFTFQQKTQNEVLTVRVNELQANMREQKIETKQLRARLMKLT